MNSTRLEFLPRAELQALTIECADRWAARGLISNAEWRAAVLLVRDVDMISFIRSGELPPEVL